MSGHSQCFTCWRWHSPDRRLYFNGYAVRLPEGLFLIDPAYSSDDDWSALDALGFPAGILLTNRDHERASDELRRRRGAPVWAHSAEGLLLRAPPDRVFADGDTLGGALKVIRFTRLKSPGECALLWPERRILFVGDLLTGHPPTSIGLVDEHQGKPEVIGEIRRLLDFDFDALLMGDGDPMIHGGRLAVEIWLNNYAGNDFDHQTR